MMIHTVYCGTVESERIMDFGFVQPEETGLLLRAVNVRTGADAAGDASTYWRLQFGTTIGGSFSAFAEIGLQKGVKASGTRMPFSREFTLARGALLGVRFAKSGEPEPMEHLSLTLEYASMSAR